MPPRRSIPLAFLLTALAAAAGAETVVTQRTLSQDAALEAASAALKKCRADGNNVSVTVLDQSGRTKAMLSDDRARPHTIEHSLRKAYTALTYARSSGEYGKQATASPLSAGPLHLEKITTAPGGLPIKAGEDVVGAIGVSGPPGGDKDEVCSQAGIDRIASGLTPG
jgi:uncharacterized protein GlcG (DUF336 family)